jgi:hypothetical protein
MAKKQTDNEIINELVAAVTPEAIPVEETPAVEEVTAVEEPVAVKEAPKAAPTPAPKKETVKEPGMYHNGRRIEAVPARVGKKWTVLIDGKREKVLKSEIEFIG